MAKAVFANSFTANNRNPIISPLRHLEDCSALQLRGNHARHIISDAENDSPKSPPRFVEDDAKNID